jgi:hypothetical protein
MAMPWEGMKWLKNDENCHSFVLHNHHKRKKGQSSVQNWQKDEFGVQPI